LAYLLKHCFYGSTQLILDRASLTTLAKNIPVDDFKELITRNSVKLSYIQQNFGVVSSGKVRVHNFAAFQVGGSDPKTTRMSFQEEISFFLEREIGRSRDIKRLGRFLCDAAKLHRFKGHSRMTQSPLLLVPMSLIWLLFARQLQ
jgi:hypothetical protein